MDFAVLNGASARSICALEHLSEVLHGMLKQKLEDTISKQFF